MRIGISTESPSLDAEVGKRFGTSKYLLIIDSETGETEITVNPGASSSSHSGIQAVIMVISKKPDILLTGYISPTAEKHLTENGIQVVREITGTARKALARFKESLTENVTISAKETNYSAKNYRGNLFQAVRNSIRQFGATLPVMLAVILILGLFQVFVGKDIVASFFSGEGSWNAFKGAIAGSLFAGNPITSYIIGGEILAQGGSLLAVTAFLVAWVTVGILQLPAEIDALGMRFALIRNGLAFIASLCIAVITVAICRYIGWKCP